MPYCCYTELSAAFRHSFFSIFSILVLDDTNSTMHDLAVIEITVYLQPF